MYNYESSPQIIEVYLAPGCYTGPDLNEWIAVGNPDPWCYPRQCHGDTDNAEEYWGGRGDTDFHARVGYNDIAILVYHFRNSNGLPPADCQTSSLVYP